MVIPYLVPDGMEVQKGKWYLVSTRFGEDLGLAYTDLQEITREKFQLKKPASADGSGEAEIDDVHMETAPIDTQADASFFDTQRILRLAAEEEVKEYKSLRVEESHIFEQARSEIHELNLEMKLINVHFLFQRKKLIFNFTADNRVDFRVLVKRLAGLFKTRIEMRQIGVRDAAKLDGGYGVCGVINCCRRSNCHINSIYLKMGKDQGFVVNSSKLTGVCGRLMCCLAYEMPFYQEELRKYPEQGALVTGPENKSYMVMSFNIIKKDVYISDEFHHQKKVPLETLKFLKREGNRTLWQFTPQPPASQQPAQDIRENGPFRR
jgi:cell fate regulator YaaT (PSP1 superfamily)